MVPKGRIWCQRGGDMRGYADTYTALTPYWLSRYIHNPWIWCQRGGDTVPRGGRYGAKGEGDMVPRGGRYGAKRREIWCQGGGRYGAKGRRIIVVFLPSLGGGVNMYIEGMIYIDGCSECNFIPL